MRLRLACPAAALAVLTVVPGALAAPSASTGGPAAVDEPAAFACTAPAGPGRVPAAAAARALLRIPSRPRVAGRRLSVDTEIAASGCLTLTLYPRGARRLDATTRIGLLVRPIADAGTTRSVVALNARGRRLLKARRAIAAMLITDFRAGPDGTGAQVTLGTPVWF